MAKSYAGSLSSTYLKAGAASSLGQDAGGVCALPVTASQSAKKYAAANKMTVDPNTGLIEGGNPEKRAKLHEMLLARKTKFKVLWKSKDGKQIHLQVLP